MATYYVRPTNGDDGNAGTSFALAWKTLQKALDTATAGDEVRLCQEAVETTAVSVDADTNAGTAASPIVFVSYSADGSTSQAGYTIRATGAMTGLVDFAAACDYTRWWGVVFDANGQSTHGIYNNVDGSDYHFFDECSMCNAGNNGIFVRGVSPLSWHIYNCAIYNNAGNGIAHSSGNRGAMVVAFSTIYGNGEAGWACNRNNCLSLCNIIHTNVGNGISLIANSSGHVAILNTIYGNGGDGIECHSTTAGNTYCMLQNTLSGNGAYGLSVPHGDISVFVAVGFNHTHGNTSGATDLVGGMPGLGNVAGNPLFASTTGGSEDFAPLAGSPLIRAGLLSSNIGVVAHLAGGGVLRRIARMIGA